jgi:glycosyltransferase involved in cell wall biosynthesis
MSEKLVSVIMPTYNDNPLYFHKAVESVQEQTYSNVELIVVDSSSDDTICNMISGWRDSRIQYYFREKRGIADALNFGIKKAHGVYIARLDADDVARPERLEKQVSYMENHQEIGVLGTSYDVINSAGDWLETHKVSKDYEQVKANLIFENPICHPSVMFRSEILKKGWEYPNVYAEDYDLWTRMVLKEKFSVMQETLVCWRRHDDNTSAQDYKSLEVSDTNSAKRYIEQLFDIDTSQYEDAVFLKNYHLGREKRSVLKKGCSYLESQIRLLFQILDHNRKLHAIDETVLHNEMEKRWQKISALFDVECDLNEETACYIKKKYEIWEKRKTEPMKFYFYGAGKDGKEAIEQYINLAKRKFPWTLEGIIDRDRKNVLIGERVIQTISCEDMKNQNSFDFVVITSDKYYNEMKRNLKEIEIDDSQIIRSSWLYCEGE